MNCRNIVIRGQSKIGKVLGQKRLSRGEFKEENGGLTWKLGPEKVKYGYDESVMSPGQSEVGIVRSGEINSGRF